jgi:16S rRNA (cytosine967-C5)-methyltransferase
MALPGIELPEAGRPDAGMRGVELPGVQLRGGLHPDIRLASMKSARAIVGSEAFRTGLLTVQGETALRAAELVEARAGERVLDLCAAPGGKTAVLAQTGAHVVACDDDERRVVRLRETLARLLPQATNVEVRVQDGTSGLEPASFDAVLADVPCSNTGVLAARPAARWRFSTQSQQDLAAIQMRLLTDAAACVKPGGRLVYSTCSIEPEENQRRVRAFVAEHPDFVIEREIEALPAPHGEHGPVDGGYAARLVRAS